MPRDCDCGPMPGGLHPGMCACEGACLEPACHAPLVQREARALATRANARQRLRVLLADGLLHTAAELQATAGYRYGARLLELRRGLDGAEPLEIESMPPSRSTDGMWSYRALPVMP